MGKKFIFLAVVAASLLDVVVSQAAGPKLGDTTGSYPGFNANKHNLSSQSSNTYKAIATGDPTARDTQICIFCHTPHNSTPQGALWNRKDTTATFGHYSTATLVILHAPTKTTASYGEPNGSSRLCLSCHDGVTALGLLKNGPQIFMQGGNDLITGIAKFDANKVRKGHHPVSFRFNPAVRDAINVQKSGVNAVQLPTLPAVKRFYGTDRVKEWMQCMTCHDPHQNLSDDTACYGGTCGGANTRKVVPFWVYHAGTNTAVADHDAVCLDCHVGLTTPAPWPYP